MKRISVTELKTKIDRQENFKLVHAMEASKFMAAHIPGSINVATKEDIAKYLDPKDEIIVYCTDEACIKSIILYQLLEAYGYTNIWRFAAGLRAWDRAGYPIARTNTAMAA